MRNKADQNIYSKMQRFAEVTKTLITNGNIRRAERCLKIAENLFTKSTSEIKNAISNVYLFSVSGYLEIHHFSVKAILPEQLRIEYAKQVNSSGL